MTPIMNPRATRPSRVDRDPLAGFDRPSVIAFVSAVVSGVGSAIAPVHPLQGPQSHRPLVLWIHGCKERARCQQWLSEARASEDRMAHSGGYLVCPSWPPASCSVLFSRREYDDCGVAWRTRRVRILELTRARVAKTDNLRSESQVYARRS
jgi:hypothetical protein